MKLSMYRNIKKSTAIVLTGLIIVTGCRQAESRSGQSAHAGVAVTVSPVRTGKMFSYLELSATSAFLFKADIKAPATGYIDDILINQGDAVEKNQSLFSIKTKEATAIMQDSLNKMTFSGLMDVKTATPGLIASIEHAKGDYVAEGDQLCQVAVTESFVFILDVPFELSGFIRLHSQCEIVLPDNRSIKGIIKTRFPSMSVNSQTERYIVRLAEPVSLPENLTGKIIIVKESVNSATSLPKSCILTDETMEQFWVMKLINDSIAVKVPVATGITEGEYVQLTHPEFKTSDLFLSSGNYGLGDTIFVKVLKKTGDEK